MTTTPTSSTETTPFEQHCARVRAKGQMDEALEQRLTHAWVKRGDRKAADQLIEAHLPLVLRMAKRLRGYGVPRDELVAEGNIGLVKAVSKFELRGVRFSTYATYWVRAQMLAAVQRHNSIVISATGAIGAKLFFRLRSARAKAEALYGAGAEGIDALLAKQFGVTEEVIRHHTARLSMTDASLDAPLREDGDLTKLDVLPSERPNPEEHLGDDQRRTLVRDALRHVWVGLSERERAVVTERFMSDDDEVTLAELGKKFKISRERMRQIEVQVRAQLRTAFEARLDLH